MSTPCCQSLRSNRLVVSEYEVPKVWFPKFLVKHPICLRIIPSLFLPSLRRKTPHNYIFLGLFTAAEGLLLGLSVSSYDADEVLLAVGICAAVTLALTIFAFQTKFDFTACGGESSDA